MVDYYEVLELNNNASLDEIKKSWRNLALRHHPDKSKDPKSAEKFIEIAEAYEALCNEKKGITQSEFTGLLIKPGKVIIGTPDNYSFVEIRYGYDSLRGTLRTSEDNHFSVVFGDGYLDGQRIPNEWVNGKVCLIEDDNLLWIKEIQRPTNAAVSDIGRVALLYDIYHDSSSSSSPKEFIDLGGTLAVIEKTGETLFTYEFGSNIEGCAISPDGVLVSIATLYPDNAVYCFDLQGKLLLWKYRSHLRGEPVLGLKFKGNQIDVFTGHTSTTAEKTYALKLDGTLTPQYQDKLDTLKKIKKQHPQEKVDSLLVMATSDDRREVIEGLSELASFAKTKGSIPNYVKIVSTLGKLLQREIDLFDPIWKVIRQILKRQPETVDQIVPNIISQIKKTAQNDATWVLSILGELGGANPSWIKAEEQFIKQKLTSKFWNERRFAAFALGSIGSADPSFVKDVIPLLIQYASDPESVRKELDEISRAQESTIQTDFTISISMSVGVDGATWLRDACIDALGMIGKRSPDSVNAAIPMLVKLSKDASSPYTVKKAIKALDAIRGL